MQDTSIPVLIVSENHDDVELFNKTLRDSGRAVRCRWVPQVDDFPAAVESGHPHLIVLFRDHHPADIETVAALRQKHAAIAPIVVVADFVVERAIGEAMQSGAQDLVSPGDRERMCAVCERELKTNRLERALNNALRSTEEYRSEVQSLLSNSADAIAVIQEGIVVDANHSWLQLFHDSDPEAFNSPLMDLFAPESQHEIKNALIACHKRQWGGGLIAVEALDASGDRRLASLSLEPSFHDGEPAIRVGVQPEVLDETSAGPDQPTGADPALDFTTGFLNRTAFLQRLDGKLGQPRTRGARALAYIRPDKFKEIEQAIGPMLTEDIIAQIATTLRGRVEESDLAGRYDGIVITILLERDSLEAISAWLEAALKEISEQVYDAGTQSLSLTCSTGLAEIGTDQDDIVELLKLAESANQRSRQAGGNRIVVEETSDAHTLIRRADALWEKRITAAFVDERFRLVHFNIASLTGARDVMFDTFVRMLDEQGDEVPTAEFIDSARRNRQLRAMDRWVIDTSFRYIADQSPDLVFVKLSDESILDAELCNWINQQLAEHAISASSICFQVSESDASRYLKQTRRLAEALRQQGYKFAIENFGIGRDPRQVLTNTPMDYIKFDGSLMANITGDVKLQNLVRDYAGLASRQGIATIATHIENANTMAVLFQLGVDYMQGYYLQEPEVVLEEAV